MSHSNVHGKVHGKVLPRRGPTLVGDQIGERQGNHHHQADNTHVSPLFNTYSLTRFFVGRLRGT